MNDTANRRNRTLPGFTLVELLIVLGIIAVLAAMLMPVLPNVMNRGKITTAKLEMSALVTGITAYEANYGRPPISKAAAGTAGPDITFGAKFPSPSGLLPVGTMAGGLILSNSEVMPILMNFTNFPGTTAPTANVNGLLNVQRIDYVNAHMPGGTSSPGVGADLVYRDPWGNPYVISLDLNGDGWCEDAFYESAVVSSGGLKGLVLQPDGYYALHGPVMVWSAGPDGKIDPASLATKGDNKDNVVSW